MSKGRINKKKNLGNTEQSKKDILNICRNTEDIDTILEFTKSEDNDIRL
jgi:hypothetical protein